MISFYLIRHGQTEWNLTGKYQGATDVPLSELGEKQAEFAAKWFDSIPLDGIFASPLVRAKVTAQKLADRKHMALRICPQFREISFGKWEGLTYEEIEARWPGAVEQMYNAPDTLHIEGGETFGQVEARTMQGIHDIIREGDNKTYAIVSHGAAIRTILCGMLGLPIHMSWHFCQSNANISRIDYYGEGQSWLYLLNSQEHLKALGVRPYIKKH